VKKGIAIVAVIFVVAGVAFFLLSDMVEDAPAPRVRFLFVSFTNAGSGNEAIFTVSNHPGSLVFRSAQIDQKTPTGWVRTDTNVPIRFGPAGMILPVSATNVPLRVIIECEEGATDLRAWFSRQFLEDRQRDSKFISVRKGFVTNDAVGAYSP
jgi:hypothetical protein